jgi:hypothetical protein
MSTGVVRSVSGHGAAVNINGMPALTRLEGTIGLCDYVALP